MNDVKNRIVYRRRSRLAEDLMYPSNPTSSRSGICILRIVHNTYYICTDIAIKIGRSTHIPGYSKTPYCRTAISFLPIVEQAKKEGRSAQIPAKLEKVIVRPEERKDIFTDTPIFVD